MSIQEEYKLNVELKSQRKPRTKNPFELHKECLDKKYMTDMFFILRDTLVWNDGIKTRHGKPTRLGSNIEIESNDIVYTIIMSVLQKLKIKNHIIHGLYLNYYKNGDDYTPIHTHPDSKQMIISLNEMDGDRKLSINSKKYNLDSGDVIIFGSQKHGIEKEQGKKGRISIAIFMKEYELGGSIAFMSN